MLGNVYGAVTQAAKNIIQNGVSWAFNVQASQITAWHEFMDDCNLRRAAFDNNFGVLFKEWNHPKERLLIPDMTIKQLVLKLAINMFPSGTNFTTADKASTELLQTIMENTRLHLKLKHVVEEAAINGFCGLRSVWSDELNEWVIEVKPYEHLEVVTDAEFAEIVRAIYVCFPLAPQPGQPRMWFREKWTATEYWRWPLTPEAVPGVRPLFSDEDRGISVETNTFGEIPITLVHHEYDPERIGQPVITEDGIKLARALIRLKNKRHYAHLEHMDPTLVTKNAPAGQEFQRGVGAHINLVAEDDQEVGAELLTFEGLPESVQLELDDHIETLFRNAGLTGPKLEEVMKSGTEVSGVALRIRDKGEEDTINTLRLQSYSKVLNHLEMLLRLGAKTRKKPEYRAINPDKQETWQIEADYPEFFPLTPQEILDEMAILEQSHLSAQERGRREAQLLEVDHPDEIQAIIDNLETLQERDAISFDVETMTAEAKAKAKAQPPGGGKGGK
jgi:hypothetical protein